MKSIFFLSLLFSLVAAADPTPSPVPVPVPAPAPKPPLPPSTPLQPINEVFAPEGKFSSAQFWKVAVVQWNPKGAAPLGVAPEVVHAYLDSTHQQMEAQIRLAAAAEAKYIDLSEYAAIGYPDIPDTTPEEDNYRSREDLTAYVETIPGPTTDHFAKVAKELGVWIQYGMAEVDAKTQAYYDSAVVINDQGVVVAKYRKHNRYHIEEKYLEAGVGLATFRTPAGVFGLLVCSDVYFQPVLDGYRRKKVDVLALSTSWAEQNTGMDNFRQAATQVDSFLLAANQNYFPDSGVINRDGTFQSHIRQSLNSIAYGYLPLAH